MNDKTVISIHWSFWAIVAVTLIFNAMGVINFLVQINANSFAAFPEEYRPIIEGRPAWATAAFAIAVFAGFLGCLLLLLRKSIAIYLLIASLLGVIATLFHIYHVTGFSPFAVWVGVLMQLVVSVFLVWYAKRVEGRSWTR